MCVKKYFHLFLSAFMWRRQIHTSEKRDKCDLESKKSYMQVPAKI